MKSSVGDARDLPEETLLGLYRVMQLIRRAEEVIADLLEAGEIKCPTHLYIGQEAVAAGVCAALRADDIVFGTHRSHGHYLAKGGDLDGMMAELLGKETGCARGRGGSMHLVAPEVGILGTSPIVAGSLPLAVGTAWASLLRGDGKVSAVFFGDGAVEEGVYHECLNFASLKKLPVVFVCENNFYSSHLILSERQPVDNIHETAGVHDLPGFRIDGNDVVQVFDTAKEAVDRARAGLGPTLIEARTYRWRGHVGPNWDLDKDIRTEQEVRSWMEKDPIKRARESLLGSGVSETDLRQIDYEIEDEITRSVEFARSSPYPDATALADFVLVP
ncbi:MAG TPA: thiamine pyrophosphate-dependent dehydrogenase E1 component subunit alpha [Actinomycetota bacterium]|nr:thiamine pyrophosphate-dependent dehydrogenase E1 component subunit alpha [Actinomycetota bacterium]